MFTHEKMSSLQEIKLRSLENELLHLVKNDTIAERCTNRTLVKEYLGSFFVREFFETLKIKN